MHWLLTVYDQEKKKKQEFHKELPSIRIGRAPDNDIVIDNTYVSSHHVTLVSDPQVVTVRDDGSRNGTFVRVGTDWKKVEGVANVALPATIRLADTITVSIGKVGYTWEMSEKEFTSLSDSREFSDMPDARREWKEAIFVLDLCHSSRLASQDDAMALHLKKRLETIAVDAFDHWHAVFKKGTGDGFLAAFRKPLDALDCAIETLKKLAERNKKSSNPAIDVRIALHFGRTYTLDRLTMDRHGNDVNVAFRLENLEGEPSFDAAAVPAVNRILLSGEFFAEATRERRGIAGDSKFLGTIKLKGIEHPCSVFLMTNI